MLICLFVYVYVYFYDYVYVYVDVYIYMYVKLGCSAAEKSLERKLGEAQKRNFKFTNGKNNIEVGMLAFCNIFDAYNLINLHKSVLELFVMSPYWNFYQKHLLLYLLVIKL